MADAFVAHASTGAQVQSVQPQQTLADDDDGLNRKQEGDGLNRKQEGDGLNRKQ